MGVKEYAKQIRAVVAESADREAATIRVHDAIAALLSGKFKGKRTGKRFVAALRESLGYPESVVVSCSAPYKFSTSDEVRIWGKESPWPTYNDAPSFSLGAFDGDPEAFERADTCHGSAARRRNEERAWLLSAQGAGEVERLAAAMEDYTQARKALAPWFSHGSKIDADTYALQKLLEWRVP